MIVQQTHEITSQRGIQSQGTFAISLRNQAHLMTILRDTLYSDKVLAVLREYGANAWDAHKDAGKGDIPIQVTLPTIFEPSLKIRDFGKGLSEEDLYQVYTQYGESSKRDSNDTVGYLGIGSKSGFAYSDSFLITSYHAGTRSVYCAVLDSTNVGEVKRLHQSPTEETGLEIEIPVKPQDVPEFVERAKALFCWFQPQPQINIPLEPPSLKQVTPYGGFYTTQESTGSWVAVMGCVPYRIDIGQVYKELQEAKLWEIARRNKGFLKFDLGDIAVNASREELKYTEKTRQKIVETFLRMVEDCWEQVERKIQDPSLSTWEKLLVEAEIKFLDAFVGNISDKVVVSIAPSDLWQLKTQSYYEKTPAQIVLRKSRATRVVVRDVPVALKRFVWGPEDLVISGPKGFQEHLRKALEHLDGLPIIRLSSLSPAPVNKAPKPLAKDRKTTVRGVALKERDYTCSYYSRRENWEPVEYTPSDTDVWVYVYNYEISCNNPLPKWQGETLYVPGFQNERDVVSTRKLAKDLGVEFPRIYGYRLSTKTPKGIPYTQWLQQFLLSLEKHPRFQEIYAQALEVAWQSTFEMCASDRQNLVNFLTPLVEKLQDPQDPLTLLWQRAQTLPSSNTPKNFAVRIHPEHKQSGESFLKLLKVRYPMLSHFGLSRISSTLGMYEYLEMKIDKYRNLPN